MPKSKSAYQIEIKHLDGKLSAYYVKGYDGARANLMVEQHRDKDTTDKTQILLSREQLYRLGKFLIRLSGS